VEMLSVLRRFDVSLGPDGKVLNHAPISIPASFNSVLKGNESATILFHSKDGTFLGVEVGRKDIPVNRKNQKVKYIKYKPR
jgi:hypothetical protein